MKPNEEDKIAIQEINQHISEGLQQWMEVLNTADADGWAFYLNYSDEDALNAIYIFNHILLNIAIKSGHINEDNAIAKGIALKKAIQDYCGIDTVELTNKVLGVKDNGGDKTLPN